MVIITDHTRTDLKCANFPKFLTSLSLLGPNSYPLYTFSNSTAISIINLVLQSNELV